MNKQPEIKVSVEMKLSINGVDCKYPQDLDEDTVQQIERQIMRLCLGRDSDSAVTEGAEQPESVLEYLDRHAPTTNDEKILVFAAFWHDGYGNSTFQKADIEKMLNTHLKKDAPKNFSRDFNKCVEKRWVADDLDEDNYCVTNTGRTALKAMLAKSG